MVFISNIWTCTVCVLRNNNSKNKAPGRRRSSTLIKFYTPTWKDLFEVANFYIPLNVFCFKQDSLILLTYKNKKKNIEILFIYKKPNNQKKVVYWSCSNLIIFSKQNPVYSFSVFECTITSNERLITQFNKEILPQ